MSYTECAIKEFSDALASSDPVPGGGGTAALAASLGTALASMAGNLTMGKCEDFESREEIMELTEKSEALREKLLRLIDADAEAFRPLAAAYSIPRDEPGRQEKMESCLRDAAGVPAEILELSCEAAVIASKISEKCPKMVASDAGCAAALCLASMRAAALNVFANTRLMRDRAYAACLNERTAALLDKYEKIAAGSYDAVAGRLT